MLDTCCWMKSKRNVVAFVRRSVGFGRLSGDGCSRCGGSARRGWGAAFTSAWTAQKLNDFADDTKLASLLTGLLVVPLVESQPSFDQQGAALAHVLRDVFRRAPEDVNINKSDLLLLFAGFIRPDTVDGQAKLRDGCTLGRVTQFRIAREVADE